MARPQSKNPTELELEILKVLWRIGPATGRAVRDELAADRDLAYTSVMTILNIMEEKGYVRRKKSGNSFIYSPRAKKETTTRRMLEDVVDRVFEGSTIAAMVNLLETSDVDDEELKQLRELLNRKRKEQSS